MLNNCRNDFPTLQGEHPPAYLDNACVTLKPQSVINSIHRYYTETTGLRGALCSPVRYGHFESRVRCEDKVGVVPERCYTK